MSFTWLSGRQAEPGGFAGLDFDAAIASVGAQEPMVRRLIPGGRKIRTVGPPVRKTTPDETAPFDLPSISAAAEAQPFLGRVLPPF